MSNESNLVVPSSLAELKVGQVVVVVSGASSTGYAVENNTNAVIKALDTSECGWPVKVKFLDWFDNVAYPETWVRLKDIRIITFNVMDNKELSVNDLKVGDKVLAKQGSFSISVGPFDKDYIGIVDELDLSPLHTYNVRVDFIESINNSHQHSLWLKASTLQLISNNVEESLTDVKPMIVNNQLAFNPDDLL